MSKKIDGWILAAQLCEVYIKSPTRTDFLLRKLPGSISPSNRKRCQFLFLGVIRNLSRIVSTIALLVEKEPRPRLKSILFVASAELLCSEAERSAGIIHHAVEQAKKILSPPEARLVNAVLRKAAKLLKNPGRMVEGAGELKRLALTHSHPEWLVRRWLDAFGPDVTEDLLCWNQTPPPIYFQLPEEAIAQRPAGLKTTKWPGFFRLSKGAEVDIGELVKKISATVMDPASARPVRFLEVLPGEKVLDLCAAPGGKSSLMARQLGNKKGLLVALDLPGVRISLLRENLERFENTASVIFEADLMQTTSEDFAARNLPCRYDAVLLDAPCSNTGVLRRRPDARWRLQPQDIALAADKQLKMLRKAVSFVAPEGRIVYSTCSLEKEENRGVVEKFLEMEKGHWRLKAESSYTPWNDGHDGGSAFLLVPA